jgi:hypothetical protein
MYGNFDLAIHHAKLNSYSGRARQIRILGNLSDVMDDILINWYKFWLIWTSLLKSG